MRHTTILMLAGLMVWLVSGINMAQALLRGWNEPMAWVHLVAWVVFALAFFLDACRQRIGFRGALFVQAVAALVLIWGPGIYGVEMALLVMVAGQLPSALSTSWCVVWILAQTMLAFLPDVARYTTSGLIGNVFGYLSFQLFALGAAGLAESERLAREELAGAKGRLEAMQERLAETTRESERLRIARELHDSLGHHLTALGLDLEAARHLVKGDGAAHVERARSLASSLMADLRSTVTELRADSGDDLVLRLRALARRDAVPPVEVTVGPGLNGVPSDIGLALTRVAQEIVTNATKHSNAGHVQLALTADDGRWILEGRDDGRGVEILRPGHGLAGMRERVEGLGGVLTIATSPGHGFTVTASVPMAASEHPA